MTPAGHLLSGYLVGEAVGARRPVVLVVAVAAAIAPDFDVALGLVGGWLGASFHRGVTHSLLAALLGAGVAAALLRPRRLVFAACLGGILTHVFWDFFNFWGVQALWPWRRYLSVNLLHEGDRCATLILLVAAVLAWRGRRRAAALWLALLLPAYLAVQVWWRDHARELARIELAGRRAAVYPTPQFTCGWIAFSASSTDLAMDCVPSPLTGRLRRVRTVPLRDDSFTRASQRSPAVREFLEENPFPFAEESAAADGTILVVWRDLREAHLQEPGEVPTGLHVRLDAAGNILSEQHRWWLRVW